MKYTLQYRKISNKINNNTVVTIIYPITEVFDFINSE